MSEAHAREWRVHLDAADPGAACPDAAAAVLDCADAADSSGLDEDVAVRLACDGREFCVRLRMARDGAGQIAAVSCEVADAASGDLLRTATVRPRIRMATIAGLDPWTRTALRQTLRRLLRAAVDGEASGRA